MNKMVEDNKVYYYKQNVSLQEYKLHAHVYDLGIVNIPKIVEYNKNTKVMKLVRVGISNISNYYGESPENISNELFSKIRKIIQTLYDHNIEYIDITGYNFIENANKIWIIDFKHAKYNPDNKNEFVNNFLEGNNVWNPEFR